MNSPMLGSPVVGRQVMSRLKTSRLTTCPVEVALGEFMDAFVRASKEMRAAQETAMRRHGLHLGQNLVLAVLWERDGRTPGDIAATLNVTTPTIVKMATRMANAGLL